MPPRSNPSTDFAPRLVSAALFASTAFSTKITQSLPASEDIQSLADQFDFEAPFQSDEGFQTFVKIQADEYVAIEAFIKTLQDVGYDIDELLNDVMGLSSALTALGNQLDGMDVSNQGNANTISANRGTIATNARDMVDAYDHFQKLTRATCTFEDVHILFCHRFIYTPVIPTECMPIIGVDPNSRLGVQFTWNENYAPEPKRVMSTGSYACTGESFTHNCAAIHPGMDTYFDDQASGFDSDGCISGTNLAADQTEHPNLCTGTLSDGKTWFVERNGRCFFREGEGEEEEKDDKNDLNPCLDAWNDDELEIYDVQFVEDARYDRGGCMPDFINFGMECLRLSTPREWTNYYSPCVITCAEGEKCSVGYFPVDIYTEV